MGKIVFFDIDGTLVDNATQVIPDSTVKALAQLRQAGHLAVLNTGRPYTHLDPRILAMDFDGCVSACGMQVQAGGRRLHWTGATQAQCRRMVELCRAWDMDTMFETPTGAVHMGPLGQEAETELARIAQRGLTVSQDVENMELIKLVAYDPAGTKTAGFCQGVGDGFTVIHRGRGMLELVPAGNSKSTGIAMVLERFGLDRQDAYAFGDSTNDLPMFRSVGTAVAMGGSPAALCQAADYVTGTVLAGGIAQGLGWCGLIPKFRE